MCGIICIYNNVLSNFDCNIIKNIQHRGQESYGVSYFKQENVITNKFIGKIPDNININLNNINYFIGHTRYSTSGKKNIKDQIQPLIGETNISNKKSKYILVHNGNIFNRKGLNKLFDCDINDNLTDTQILVNVINNMNENSWEIILNKILNLIPGVFSLIIGTHNKVYILRDQSGIRPLCVMKSDKGYCIISEPNKMENYGFSLVRDINPGELCVLNENGLETISKHKNKFTPCLFEYIYFLNKNSIVDDVSVTVFRYNCGKELAKREHKIFSDKKNTIVVGAPETGITSGIAYAEYLNLNYFQVMTKKSKDRTFIIDEKQRNLFFKDKYNINSEIVKDKIIIIVDDSLVRGNTLKRVVELFFLNKAKEVHLRIASPPVISPCYFGIDIPTYTELIAYRLNENIEEINNELKSDSLYYLDISTLTQLIPNKRACSSCFTNEYNRELLDW